MPSREAASREVVVWVPPRDTPEGMAKRAKDAKMAALREAQLEAQTRLAEAKIKLWQARGIIADLIHREMGKYLKMSEHPDFQNTVGPLSAELVMKLAEWISKEDRLDSGKATENLAVTVGPSLDFSRFTQEERDAWRELALKGGVPEE